MLRKWDDMEGRWIDEGGADEPYDDSPDREPRNPKAPDKAGGAEVEIPKEEEIICCV